MKRIIVMLFLGCIMVSCGSKKATAKKRTVQKQKTERVVVERGTNPSETLKDVEDSNNSTPMKLNTTEDYLVAFGPIAQEEMRLYGIPASIKLAQGILESSSGKGRLSVEANNHFGIKCHEWTGDRIYHDDDALQECFRKYVDAKYSFRDHSIFLTGRSRYAGLFKLKKNDYKAWAKGLKAAGYATDKKYPDKLISLIERYQLHKLDEEVLGYGYVNSESVSQTGHTVYKVVKGDTLYSISKKHNVTIKELQQMNGLNDTTLRIGQELQIKPSKNF